jgi:SAM-dependent methyltransferase
MDERMSGAGVGGSEMPYVPLPGGLADPRRTARAVFDTIAEIYDVARPGYPSQALRDLAGRCGLNAHSQVLEIGCGTGQATRDLAPIGAAIHCLEPGRALADLARRNLASAANVQVSTTAFEDLEEEPRSYDVIVSATAFHWVDPAVSFAKAAQLLRTGGSLALLTNAHAHAGNHTEEDFAREVRRLHQQLAPEIGSWTFPTVDELRERARAAGDIAAVWSRIDRKLADPPIVSELFDTPVISLYPWLASYGRTGYLQMLASQSSYALLDDKCRRELLDGIGRLIDLHLGGSVTKQYLTILATARNVSS